MFQLSVRRRPGGLKLELALPVVICVLIVCLAPLFGDLTAQVKVLHREIIQLFLLIFEEKNFSSVFFTML